MLFPKEEEYIEVRRGLPVRQAYWGRGTGSLWGICELAMLWGHFNGGAGAVHSWAEQVTHARHIHRYTCPLHHVPDALTRLEVASLIVMHRSRVDWRTSAWLLNSRSGSPRLASQTLRCHFNTQEPLLCVGYCTIENTPVCLSPLQWFTKAGFTDVKITRIGPKWYRGVRRHGLIMGCSVTGVKPKVGVA